MSDTPKAKACEQLFRSLSKLVLTTESGDEIRIGQYEASTLVEIIEAYVDARLADA
jgi:hypothetical protein